MSDRMQFPENDPRHHTIKIRALLTDLAAHAREDVRKVDEPKAQALFETTAEVCTALATTYEHYEKQSETAWQR